MLPLDVKTSYDASALTKLMRDFGTRGGNVGNLTPVIAEDLVSCILERFELQSGFSQGAWEALEDSTIDARRVSKSPKMLEDSGVLLGSITPFDDAETAEAYTNVPYAKYHVSAEPRTKIPLRDFTDIDFAAVSDRAAELVLAELTTFDS